LVYKHIPKYILSLIYRTDTILKRACRRRKLFQYIVSNHDSGEKLDGGQTHWVMSTCATRWHTCNIICIMLYFSVPKYHVDIFIYTYNVSGIDNGQFRRTRPVEPVTWLYSHTAIRSFIIILYYIEGRRILYYLHIIVVTHVYITIYYYSRISVTRIFFLPFEVFF